MIAVIDLGIGNVGSLMRALHLIGAPARRVESADRLGQAPAAILPGVGAFGEAMQMLRGKGLADALRSTAAAGTPILGICLGMQLLAGESEEHGRHEGLGLIGGKVTRLRPSGREIRVPNIGWLDVTPTRSGTLFDAHATGCFYHVHSYHFAPEEPSDVAATIDYGGQGICVAVERDAICGVQFHPEKSQDDGLDLLARFAERLRRAGRIP